MVIALVLCVMFIGRKTKMVKTDKTYTLTSNNSLIFLTRRQQIKYLKQIICICFPHTNTHICHSQYISSCSSCCVRRKKTTTLKKQSAQTVRIKHHFISLSKKRGWNFTLQLLKVLKKWYLTVNQKFQSGALYSSHWCRRVRESSHSGFNGRMAQLFFLSPRNFFKVHRRACGFFESLTIREGDISLNSSGKKVFNVTNNAKRTM